MHLVKASIGPDKRGVFRLNIIEFLVFVGNKSVQVLNRCLDPIFLRGVEGVDKQSPSG